MSKLNPCPECKSFDVVLADEDALNSLAFCITCGYMGESFDAITLTREEADEKAVAAWNALPRTDWRKLARDLAAYMLGNPPKCDTHICEGCGLPCAERVHYDMLVRRIKDAGLEVE